MWQTLTLALNRAECNPKLLLIIFLPWRRGEMGQRLSRECNGPRR